MICLISSLYRGKMSSQTQSIHRNLIRNNSYLSQASAPTTQEKSSKDFKLFQVITANIYFVCNRLNEIK